MNVFQKRNNFMCWTIPVYEEVLDEHFLKMRMISFLSFILKPDSGLLVFVWAVEMEKRFAELIGGRPLVIVDCLVK